MSSPGTRLVGYSNRDLLVKKILFFLEGNTVPASRFRVKQFQDLLRSKGYEFKFLTTVPNKYLYIPPLIRNIPLISHVWLALMLIFIISERLWQIIFNVRKFNVIVFQRDLLYRINFPFLEFLIFSWAQKGTRFVFDVDDAIYLDKFGVRATARWKKLSYILKRCDAVIAGNEYLKNNLKGIANAVVIPTVVDTKIYPVESRENIVPIVGWSGVRTNLKYLKTLKDNSLLINQNYQK